MDYLIFILNIMGLILLIFSIHLNFLIVSAITISYIIVNKILIKRKLTIIKKVNKYLCIALIIFNIIFIVINKTNIMQNFSSVHEIKNFILSTKEWGIAIFFLIEFLQVIALPIPSFLIILAGVNIWGVWQTIVICGSSVILASSIAFFIGKLWGVKAITKLMGKTKYESYKNLLSKNCMLYLSLMFIFPFFPDDLLCVLAGTTDMKFYQFFIISLLTRPISIIVTALLGEYFIDFLESNSLKNIILFLVIIILSVFILFKNKNKILNFINNKIKKKQSKI